MIAVPRIHLFDGTSSDKNFHILKMESEVRELVANFIVLYMVEKAGVESRLVDVTQLLHCYLHQVIGKDAPKLRKMKTLLRQAGLKYYFHNGHCYYKNCELKNSELRSLYHNYLTS